MSGVGVAGDEFFEFGEPAKVGRSRRVSWFAWLGLIAFASSLGGGGMFLIIESLDKETETASQTLSSDVDPEPSEFNTRASVPSETSVLQVEPPDRPDFVSSGDVAVPVVGRVRSSSDDAPPPTLARAGDADELSVANGPSLELEPGLMPIALDDEADVVEDATTTAPLVIVPEVTTAVTRAVTTSPAPATTFGSPTTRPVATLATTAATVTPAASVEEGARHPIALPIDRDRLGEVTWTDTWGFERGNGTRRHLGVDMMGPRMVPLVAARDSIVVWGRFDNDKGSIVRLMDSDGWLYQYIHLNNDSKPEPTNDDGQATCEQALSAKLCATISSDGSLAYGTSVAEGEVIGFMGDGGNAEETLPHLHFEIYEPFDGQPVAINPTPFVNFARDNG